MQRLSLLLSRRSGRLGLLIGLAIGFVISMIRPIVREVRSQEAALPVNCFSQSERILPGSR